MIIYTFVMTIFFFFMAVIHTILLALGTKEKGYHLIDLLFFLGIGIWGVVLLTLNWSG